MQIVESGSIHTAPRLVLEWSERVRDSLAREITPRLEKAPGPGLHHSQEDPHMEIAVELLCLAIGQ